MDLHLLAHPKVGEVADVTVEIVHIIDARFMDISGAHASNNYSSVHDVYYKPTRDRLEQMTIHEAVKENKKEKPKRNCREDVQLLANFKMHRPAFWNLWKISRSCGTGI